jgi:PAS domain S-box-containing protein
MSCASQGNQSVTGRVRSLHVKPSHPQEIRRPRRPLKARGWLARLRERRFKPAEIAVLGTLLIGTMLVIALAEIASDYRSTAREIERRVESMPAYASQAAQGQESAAAFAAWRQRAVRTGLGAVLLAALLAYLLRLLKRMYAMCASLEASEARYERAMAASNAGHWDWNLITNEGYFSPRARELYGLPKELASTNAREFIEQIPVHPQDRPRERQALDDHLAGRTPRYEIEYRLEVRPGEIRWLHVRGLCFRDWSGKPIRLTGSTIDITARKQAEEALRRSEERFALAMTGSDEGHWYWNIVTGELYLSPRHKEIHGFARDAVFDTREEWAARIPLHPDDARGWRDSVAEHLAGRTPRLDLEYRIEPGCGEIRWVQERGQCFRDADGRPIHMAGSTLDITERKRAEADRERLEAQLRQAQKLEAIGTLAGGIAHDFNNVLAAILGYGELAQKGLPEGSALRRQIEHMVNAGQRAKALVERILAFGRGGAGVRQPVHVQCAVAETLDLLAASMPAGIRLERELDADYAAILGDASHIHQVVMNLGTNAVQAMNGAGRLCVRLDLHELDAPLSTTTGTLSPGKYVRLTVDDTGAGIAPHVLERMFDPFFTTKEVGMGTGLGLSLVHGIVTDLGGQIEARSQVGAGATFVVYLPWHGRTTATRAAAQEVRRGNGQTVLLVDDEETLVRLGEETLAALGYEPVGFTSSAQALETFRSAPERFDAVLTDETMPGMSGSQMTSEIRKLRADIPVVLMSGYLSPGLNVRARAAGANEVLAKPLASQDLGRVLASVLRL